MSANAVLLIVDPQIDFISGSLPVPQAEEAMVRLARWIEQEQERYDTIMVTMDQHPIDHCSFVHKGGPWPMHCVRYSQGAAIYPAVFEAMCRVGKPITFVEKATSAERDEYSAFKEDIPTELLEAEQIYLSGLAGDYCVKETEQDLLGRIPRERIHRLESCIAYITPPQV